MGLIVHIYRVLFMPNCLRSVWRHSVHFAKLFDVKIAAPAPKCCSFLSFYPISAKLHDNYGSIEGVKAYIFVASSQASTLSVITGTKLSSLYTLHFIQDNRYKIRCLRRGKIVNLERNLKKKNMMGVIVLKSGSFFFPSFFSFLFFFFFFFFFVQKSTPRNLFYLVPHSVFVAVAG